MQGLQGDAIKCNVTSFDLMWPQVPRSHVRGHVPLLPPAHGARAAPAGDQRWTGGGDSHKGAGAGGVEPPPVLPLSPGTSLYKLYIYIYNNDTSDLPRPLPAGLLPHVLCQLSQRTEFGWQAVMSHLRVSPSQSGDIEILWSSTLEWVLQFWNQLIKYPKEVPTSAFSF